MTYQFVTTDSGITEILMEFLDEGVNLTVSRKVAGDTEKAMTQVKVLEADARRDYAELFPLPEVMTDIEGELP
ncbi:MAG: hypothetical protein GX911_02160 [Spirochaetales bacterium]|nr:hypothetical protein [Spirochaetales bacterium]